MSSIKASIIVPTYKEAENIPVLCERIHTVMNESGYRYEIIIVDDDSGDGTINVVENINKSYSVFLHTRLNDRGLSSAVLTGFTYATGDIFIVMDADMSHPADKIPEFINAIEEEGYEFVIGSRFIDGGSIPHFNTYRRLNAWAARFLARILVKLRDPMSGFFAFPSRIIKSADSLNPLGFKIGLELIVKCEPIRIKEIPIVFRERLYGESKLSLKEQIRYLVHIKRLFEFKYQGLAELIKFSLVGSTGMAVDLIIVYISKDILLMPFRIARAVGFIFAVSSNFLLNRRFTFKRASKRNLYRQYIEFLGFSLVGFIINWLISVYLYETFLFFHENYLLAAFTGILGGMLINFSGNKFITFR